jgi:hypothetical protein
MIIDKSYFQGNLNIPNVQENLTPLGGRRGNQSNLDSYIAKYEVKVMKDALGLVAYKSFIASFEANGDVKPTADQRWKDLINGVEYTYNGEDYEWEGLRYTLGTYSYSLIADYVFSIFLNDTSRTLGSPGMVKEATNSAETVSSIPRISEAWNTFIEKYQGESSDEDYPRLVSKPGLRGIDWSQHRSASDINMYTYLSDNESQYEDVKFRLYESTNSFGL